MGHARQAVILGPRLIRQLIGYGMYLYRNAEGGHELRVQRSQADEIAALVAVLRAAIEQGEAVEYPLQWVKDLVEGRLPVVAA